MTHPPIIFILKSAGKGDSVQLITSVELFGCFLLMQVKEHIIRLGGKNPKTQDGSNLQSGTFLKSYRMIAELFPWLRKTISSQVKNSLVLLSKSTIKRPFHEWKCRGVSARWKSEVKNKIRVARKHQKGPAEF